MTPEQYQLFDEMRRRMANRTAQLMADKMAKAAATGAPFYNGPLTRVYYVREPDESRPQSPELSQAMNFREDPVYVFDGMKKSLRMLGRGDDSFMAHIVWHGAGEEATALDILERHGIDKSEASLAGIPYALAVVGMALNVKPQMWMVAVERRGPGMTHVAANLNLVGALSQPHESLFATLKRAYGQKLGMRPGSFQPLGGGTEYSTPFFRTQADDIEFDPTMPVEGDFQDVDNGDYHVRMVPADLLLAAANEVEGYGMRELRRYLSGRGMPITPNDGLTDEAIYGCSVLLPTIIP